MNLKMAKPDKLANTIGLYVLIGFIALVVLGWFVIRPVFAGAGTTKAEANQMRAKVAALEELGRDTEELKRNYEAVRDERDRILAQLPVKSEEERLLALLSDIAQRTGVKLSSFTPAAETAQTPAASLSIYPASINISGIYPAILRFFEEVEAGARFVDVQAGALSAQQVSGTASVSSQVQLKAYYQSGVVTIATGGQNGASSGN